MKLHKNNITKSKQEKHKFLLGVLKDTHFVGSMFNLTLLQQMPFEPEEL